MAPVLLSAWLVSAPVALATVTDDGATPVAAAPVAPAAAAPPATAAPPADAVAPAPNPAAGERYDARLDPPPKRRWRLLPQILLFPFRALLLALRYPVGAALRFEDRVHPTERAIGLVTWSDGARGIRPAFYYTSIYIPEFGVRYFDNVLLGVDTNFAAVATIGGANYVSSSLTVEPTRRHDRVGVVFDVLFDRRGDLLYNGLGSHTYSDAPAGRYLLNALETRLAVRLRPIPWLSVYGTFGSGIKRFANGDKVGGDPGLFSVYDPSTIVGFDGGTTFVRAALGAVLDLRDDVTHASSGLLVQASFDYTHGIDGDYASYDRLRALAAVPIRLWARSHVLWLQAATSLAWPRDGRPIPFSELPTLGGPNDLRGFRFQDFRDYSALWFTAEYRWPLWMWLDGALFADYGGVFAQNYGGIGARRMQPDVGVAIHLPGGNTFGLSVQLGYGFGEGPNFSISGNAP
ncbi:MAG TPA: BamA/TamA family outer membrane protein [Polyangia bacterium]|jgi:hypothetical protein